jgi:hypothetical protein
MSVGIPSNDPDPADPDAAPERRRTVRPWAREGRVPVSEIELRKMQSHVAALRSRAERLLAGGPAGSAQDGVRKQVRDLLDLKTTQLDDADLHDHADQLDELLPFIADECHLATKLAFELARTDTIEERKLSDLFDPDRLGRLRSLSATQACSTAGNYDPARHHEMAEALGELIRDRAEWLRHDRLMRSLRARYLIRFGLLMAALLPAAVTVATLLSGSHAGVNLRAQLLVMAMGALGSVIAALFTLRDVLTVVSFRQATRMIWLQPLVGATFGLLTWYVLTGGILKVSGSTATDWRVFATIALIAGFSEPFALGIVKRVSVL